LSKDESEKWVTVGSRKYKNFKFIQPVDFKQVDSKLKTFKQDNQNSLAKTKPLTRSNNFSVSYAKLRTANDLSDMKRGVTMTKVLNHTDFESGI